MRTLALASILILCWSTAKAQPSPEERRQIALALLEAFDTTAASPHWPYVPPAEFYNNVRTNIGRPEKIYQGHNTNFCGYSAITVVLCRDYPDLYTQHIIELYSKGETTINGTLIKPSASVRQTAGALEEKGKLEINPADQLWLMSLPDHFKSYMNIDRKFKPGDENLIWAACTLGKFNDMARKLGNYKVTSKGTDLIKPGIKELVPFLHDELSKGTVVLYVNSKYLHPSKFRIFTLRAPTHFIILYDIREENGSVIFTYWDYGLKTLEIMSYKRIKKMTFGIIRLNKA